MPKVSVLIPCYNVEKFIKQCLDSVLNQTLTDIEIICINDGSKDSTLEILEDYAANDERIVILNKENSGYGDSMNRAMELSTGEYIGIVESDDYIRREMFERLYTTASKYDLDIVKANFYLWWSDTDKIITHQACQPEECNYIFEPKNYKNGTMFSRKPSIWSAIYRTDFLRNNSITFLDTPGASYQDTSFTFKVLTCAKKMACISDELYFYRQDNEESSVNNADKKSDFVLREYEEIKRFIDTLGNEDEDISDEAKNNEKCSLSLIYVSAFYDACIWMYELLSPNKRLEFLYKISPIFEEMIFEHGVDKIPFGLCWWKKRDIVRIAREPFEYHIWRDDERIENNKEKVLKQIVQAASNIPDEDKIAKNMNPFFSIIIPVYNAEKHIQACLDSLRYQTFSNYEVICINDGSTDKSEEIIKSFQKTDNRIRLICTGNKGVSHARNIGIKEAIGKYILLLDADDHFDKDTCKIVCESLIANNEPDMLVFGGKPFLPDGRRPDEWFYKVLTTPDLYFEKVSTDDIFSKKYLSVFCWRCAYKKEYVVSKQLSFMEGRKYGEDAIFMISALHNADGVVVISDKLYHYRTDSEGSAMTEIKKKPERFAKEQIDILENILRYASQNNLSHTMKLLPFAIDFVYGAIMSCPMPNRNKIASSFVSLIDSYDLNKYETDITDDEKDFINKCRQGSFETDSYTSKDWKKSGIVKRTLLKILPPSRAAFYDYMCLVLQKLE